MTHLCLVPKLRMIGTLPSLSLKACMACEGTTLPYTNNSLNILKLHMEFCIS